MIDVLHTITPGDHFSPRTGSAIPTVVDGLARAAGRDCGPFRHSVVIDRTTMRPRYGSAAVIEYDGARGPTSNERVVDLARGRVGLPRSGFGRGRRLRRLGDLRSLRLRFGPLMPSDVGNLCRDRVWITVPELLTLGGDRAIGLFFAEHGAGADQEVAPLGKTTNRLFGRVGAQRDLD